MVAAASLWKAACDKGVIADLQARTCRYEWRGQTLDVRG